MYASGSTSSPLMLMHAEANWPFELQPPPEAAGDASACPAAAPEMAMAAAAIAAVRRMSMLIVMWCLPYE